jgi:ribosome recycling factor
MNMGTDEILFDAEERMEKALDVFKDHLRGLRTGRATPALVDNLRVEYYGSPTPLKQMAQISTPDPTSIVIRPFDPSVLKDIEKAIRSSDLGMSPNNDGKMIRLTVPPMSGEQRQKMVARIKKSAEDAKVALRNIRRDANENVKKLLKDKGGRGAVVLPDGMLFGEGVKAKVKELLLRDCHLHTVVRLPNGVFNPYTGIKTNLLFFTKGKLTTTIWFYEHRHPVGVTSYSKTKPLRVEELQPIADWWGKESDGFTARTESEVLRVDELPAGGRVVTHHPRDAHENDREENCGRDAKIGDLLLGLEILDNRTDLETDEDKREHVEDEYGRLPHGVRWHT